MSHCVYKRSTRLAGIAVLLVGGAGSAFAQQATTLQNDAQRVQRYYEQQKPQEPNETDPLKQPQPNVPGQKVTTEGQRFELKKVEFTSSALLPQADLDAAVAPYLGKQVSGTELAGMLDKVNALYAARKITTARAVFKNQPIVDGVVHVELVEGRLGKVEVKGARHVDDKFVRRRIHQKDGEVVDTDRLREDLVYLNRTTDLQVKALLQPGETRGQTDILLQVDEPQRHTIDGFIDNNGIDSSGRWRVGVQGALYGLMGVDDRLSGNIAHSKGGNDGAVSYSMPIMPNNGRLGVSYSHSQIDIVQGAFRNLHITGTSSVTSLDYNQPLIATMNWLFSGIGAYSIGHSSTDISGQHIADTRTQQITLGLSLAHQQDGQRWSVTQLYTRIHSDEPMLGKDNFDIAPGSASFMQRLGQSQWAVRADLGWQFSRGKNLPSANLFQIGGLGSVRGYERGVLSGPRGYYFSAELHRSFGPNLDLYGFADTGSVYAAYPSNQSITGAGVGGLYRYRTWLTVSADVAKPFNTVTPDQDSVRANFRLTLHWE
ncbi:MULTISPECIES: ShlB/FhaC/HecB family hemolysin secretion/activation protein [Dyella]|nr:MULTISPECIES: ShlB/FhaC/HecB family hemolysin secretion/activation protein [Dyella]